MVGIFISMGFIMFLAYKGLSPIWVAPIAAAFVAFTGGADVLNAYVATYMQGFVGFTVNWFPIFMLGAILGKLMDSTKMAKSVAVTISNKLGPKHAILAVVLAGSVLTYGGISMFVAVFALYPLAIVLFREANIPRRLIPAAITVGVFAYTMVTLPGSPQIQNLIPGQHFGTPATAAPVLGILTGIVMGGGGLLYVIWKAKKMKAAGEVFTEPPSEVAYDPNETLPNFWLSLTPLVLVVVSLNLFNWHIIVSLIAAILLILVLNVKHYKTFVSTINEGAKGAMLPIISVSAIVGYGWVVQSVPAFTVLVDHLMNIPGPPFVSLAVAVNLIAGVTGSASGGLAIALGTLAETYIEIAATYGYSLEAMHRVAAVAASVMDTVPHNGAILTLLAVTGMTHRESYFDIAQCTITIPLIALVFCIILASLGVV